MSGSKYMIEQNGQYLGRWTAHTPEEALDKMFHSSYSQCYNIDDYGTFTITKNGKTTEIQM